MLGGNPVQTLGGIDKPALVPACRGGAGGPGARWAGGLLPAGASAPCAPSGSGGVRTCSETPASVTLSLSWKKRIWFGFFSLRLSCSPNLFLGAGFFFSFAMIWVWEGVGDGKKRGFRRNALQGEISALQQTLVGTEGGGWRATSTDGHRPCCTSLGKWLINITGIYSSI